MTAHRDRPSRLLGVRAEVWTVAADKAGLWLVDADGPWRGDLIDAESTPHAAVESMLAQRGLRPSVWLLHSTSWRRYDHAVALTYLAVLDPAGQAVRVCWPAARASSPTLAVADVILDDGLTVETDIRTV